MPTGSKTAQTAQENYEMGMKYYNGDQGHMDGQTTVKDYGTAAKYLHMAADAEHAVATAQLGIMFWSGQGVRQSDSEAIKHWTHAADKDEPVAEIQVARRSWCCCSWCCCCLCCLC